MPEIVKQETRIVDGKPVLVSVWTPGAVQLDDFSFGAQAISKYVKPPNERSPNYKRPRPFMDDED